MVSKALFKKYYPDDSRDGTLRFYNWLRSFVRPDYTALNVGAGMSSDNRIRSLKGEVSRVYGVDIDREVLNNNDLDEAIVITGSRLPFPDNAFDLAWSDYVLEHIEYPEIFIKEIFRILRPGASFFFRTPNKHHYVSLIARMTPHWFHELAANRARGLPHKAHGPYPTFHRLNSGNDIAKHSAMAGFRKTELRYVEAEPSYLLFSTIPFLMGVLYERTVNSSASFSCLRSNIFGRLEK